MKISTINPATEEPLNTYEYLEQSVIDKKIQLGHEAYLQWRKTPPIQRQGFMLQLAHILEERKEALALLIAQEMGKPITAGKIEIEKCAWACEHFALNAEDYLAPRIVQTEMHVAKVCYVPAGLVFAVMPWNFPFWQVFRFAVPNVMAGNGAVIKHASISLGAGMMIEQLFKEAGFPTNLVQHLLVNSKNCGPIIENPHIIGVTLTGSDQAGRELAAQAGRCLKKSVLELGGSDPYVVLEDADLDLAAQCIVTSRLNNSGQVCIAAKRVIVHQQVAEELTNKIIHHMSLFKMGDPLDPKTNLGPLARHDLRETLKLQVEKSVKQGAKLLCGGIIPEGKGFFYPPTLLTQVTPGMPAFDDELFGPVIAVTIADTEQHAIDYANQSTFGLGAAVFTRNLVRGERIATQDIEAGVCFVNAFVATDPRLPFGGIKQSGYGRELSKEGILEFVNIKTIAISDS